MYYNPTKFGPPTRVAVVGGHFTAQNGPYCHIRQLPQKAITTEGNRHIRQLPYK